MKNILIINSSKETMLLLEKWLERKAYNVKFTTHLEEVVPIIEEFAPQLIIIDIDQKEVIPAIKNYDDLLLLLLMTGYTYNDTYSGLPVDDIIEKPFSLELLEKKVDQLMTNVVES
ncbi:MAG: hypothetical protein M3015_12815 [Bacteroidota bacterium]|nr:hypothetical protein [Bacteroidota bacterium]